jgi:hypothetical protein
MSTTLEVTEKVDARVSRAWLPDRISVELAIAALVYFTFLHAGHHTYVNYFVPLAQAFLHGQLGVAEHPAWLNELVPWNGHWYMVYPPFPAVLLMPFVALFGPNFDQGVAGVLVAAFDVLLMGELARGMGVTGKARWAFGILFAFGTIIWLSARLSTSWHFAHLCAIMGLAIAIRLVQLRMSPVAIGLFLGIAAMSRLPAMMAFPFFVAYFAWCATQPAASGVFGAVDEPIPVLGKVDEDAIRRFLGACVRFGFGLGIPLLACLAYNMQRFGAPFQMGYALIPGVLQEYEYRFGIFSWHNIGRNLNAMLLQGPRPTVDLPFFIPARQGPLSLLLTTPAFVWAVKARGPNLLSLGCWVSCALTLVPVLTHGDIGGEQFGYRFAQDIYPFLFLLMIRGMDGKLTTERVMAIALGLLVNFWGMACTVLNWLT